MPQYTTVEECVKRMEEGFWRRYNASADLREKLAGKTRIIQLALSDGPSYWFHIVDGKLTTINPGVNPAATATVTVAQKDLLAVFNGELKPVQAYLTGRVKLKASFGDILFAKSLFG